MFKKLLSLAMATIMVMGIGTTAFASDSVEQYDEYVPENYTHYTYDLSLSRSLQNVTNDQKIDHTIAFNAKGEN